MLKTLQPTSLHHEAIHHQAVHHEAIHHDIVNGAIVNKPGERNDYQGHTEFSKYLSLRITSRSGGNQEFMKLFVPKMKLINCHRFADRKDRS